MERPAAIRPVQGLIKLGSQDMVRFRVFFSSSGGNHTQRHKVAETQRTSSWTSANDSLDSVFQNRGLKIHQQSQLKSRDLEIGADLRLVQLRQFHNGLQFDD